MFLYGNYGGDVLNFGLAAELAEAEGIRVATVLAADDVASAPSGEEERRRGIAGIFFLYKVAGACAEEGVLFSWISEHELRAVTHNDVTRADCERAADILRAVLGA